MKILIIGSNETWAIERIYLKYLAELKVDVDLFAAQSLFYKYYNRGILSKLLYKSGLSNITLRINKAARKKIEEYRPAVIWVFKGMEITPALLKWASREGIRLVNYNPDNPFIFSGTGSGNKNITDGIPYYDLHFTYNLSTEKELQKRFNAVTAFLPFGFDVRNELYQECCTVPEIGKACFLGNPDKKRAVFLEELASGGIHIDLFGNGWNKFVAHKNIRIFQPVYEDAFWKVLRSYRVQINLMRIHNEDSHNMRSFEIPGIGGIMLAPDTPEHRFFFENGKEIFLFNDATECAGHIRNILALTDEEAGIIRESARKRSISSGYTYKDRARFAFDVMNKLYNE